MRSGAKAGGRGGNERVGALVALATVVFVLAVILRLVSFSGLVASDDVNYARYARQIVDGVYSLELHHQAARPGVILPTALFYWLFGVSEWTTVAWPLLCSSLAAALVAFLAGRLYGYTAAIVAGALAATFPVDVRFATVLFPEPVVGAFAAAAGILYWEAGRRASSVLASASGLLLGVAFLAKEPAAFLVVAFAAAWMLERRWKLVAALALGAGAVVVAEAAWYWYLRGDWLFRFHALATHNNLFQRSVEHGAPGDLVYRLVKAYPRMMLYPSFDFGVHSLVALVLGAVALLVRFREHATRWLFLWAAIPFIYLDWGSSSLTAYIPIPTDSRYIAFVYAPLFVLAAGALAALVERWQPLARFWVSGVIVTAAIGALCAYARRQTSHRSADVRELRALVATVRAAGGSLCGFVGRDAVRWLRTIQILAPEQLRCSGTVVYDIVPGPTGLPTLRRHDTVRVSSGAT
jgi:4-amino-4-deoxy-L-arabinose transferase-like glycosyltransferase